MCVVSVLQLSVDPPGSPCDCGLSLCSAGHRFPGGHRGPCCGTSSCRRRQSHLRRRSGRTGRPHQKSSKQPATHAYHTNARNTSLLVVRSWKCAKKSNLPTEHITHHSQTIKHTHGHTLSPPLSLSHSVPVSLSLSIALSHCPSCLSLYLCISISLCLSSHHASCTHLPLARSQQGSHLGKGHSTL
jgi:hypothetical protein